jgi:hypothetical protein
VTLPAPDDVPDRRQQRKTRHEPFVLFTGSGSKTDSLWPPVAAGLRLSRMMDSWLIVGPTFMHGGGAPKNELRKGIADLNEEWTDLREPLLIAYDALAFMDLPDDAPVPPAAGVDAAFERALLALADAADSYERHGCPEYAVSLHQLVIEVLPADHKEGAAQWAEVLLHLSERCNSALERLSG